MTINDVGTALAGLPPELWIVVSAAMAGFCTARAAALLRSRPVIATSFAVSAGGYVAVVVIWAARI